MGTWLVDVLGTSPPQCKCRLHTYMSMADCVSCIRVVCTKVLTQQPSHDHEVIPMPPPQRSELEGTTTVYTSYVMIRQYMCCTK